MTALSSHPGLTGPTVPTGIRRAQSCASDTATAVREFHDAVAHEDMALVLFFCSPAHDLATVESEMKGLFAGVPVVGCTTAGEIGPLGCLEHSLCGASFPEATFTVASGYLSGLRDLQLTDAEVLVEDLLDSLQRKAPDASGANTFALLLTDGLCGREEAVTRVLQHLLGDIAIVGGSAGDDLRFEETSVFHDGRFRSDSAVVVLVSTLAPFEVFNTQHFVPSDQRVVVTAADGPRRIVEELDGWPAAQEYARLVGVDVDDLDPMRFAAAPMVVMIDGSNYVRSIQTANTDGSLTFYCAIEEGLVLRSARGVDLVGNLDRALDELRAALGPLELVIGFDCVLRKQEMVKQGFLGQIGAIFGRANAIGFNSYGEQYGGVHVNQTLTGVAIGQAQ